MSAHDRRIEAAGRFLRGLATARQSAALYPPGHQQRLDLGRGLTVLGRDLQDVTGGTGATIFVHRGSFYLGPVLLPRESLGLGKLADELGAAGLESLTLTNAATPEDLDALLDIVAGRAPLREAVGGLRLNSVRPVHEQHEGWETRLADLRRAYASGVTELREASTRMAAGEPIDLASASVVVENLHDEVQKDPGYGLLLSAVKSYDEYTYFHMVNVCLLSVALGQIIGLRRDQVMVLGLGGLLHDIGKIFVPSEVLNATGRLDEEQWRLVQRHPIDGAAELLATGVGFHHPATAIVLEHHAAYDGGGYPGLHHHPPSVPSRLVSVADCFDAVTSKRSYRDPMDRHDALALLDAAAGQGLDPDAVAAFQRMLGRYPVGSLVRLSSGEVGLVVRQHHLAPERPTVLLLFDRTDTPTDIEERDLALDAHGPTVVQRVAADVLDVDLPRFVASGTLHVRTPGRPGGLVHEPSPGERPPEGYVDTHAEAHHHLPQPPPDSREDPDVAPPFADDRPH